MLSPRGRRILFALVSEYLASGEPIPSSSLAKTLDLSSASIRAVLAELEGQGYLHKPHTSAGRVPTGIALRAFVDALLETVDLTGELRLRIETHFASIEPGPEAALRAAGKLLADVSGAASVVMTNPTSDRTLREMRFLWLRPGEVLAVLVWNEGSVQNRVLRTESSVTPSTLEHANNALAPLIAGQSLAQLRAMLAKQLETERARVDVLTRLALSLGERALSNADLQSKVVVEGQAQLIQRPEFSDIDRARIALRVLEDKVTLLQLLDRTIDAPGIQVVIGNEDQGTRDGELSMVAAPVAGGAIGVIGSTRLDYGAVVPAVRFTAHVLSRVLARSVDRDER
ncbi:MAG: heat-inducible transcriptional repressor HrcA [Deltaproteobacteria bacterium]|nr:heat-inducible transcriptional repressor HrcA [Deltaproteobacteria bacterium]